MRIEVKSIILVSVIGFFILVLEYIVNGLSFSSVVLYCLQGWNNRLIRLIYFSSRLYKVKHVEFDK
jgi:hypothetical protein